MISLKKLLYKMVEAINANHLPAATTSDEGMVLGIKRDGTYGLIPQSGGGSGANLIVLSGTIQNVPNGSTRQASYTAAQLANYGISSIDNIAVVSVKQSNFTAGYRYGNTYGGISSGMTTYSNTYPIVQTSSNTLYITVLNGQEGSGSANIAYEVVIVDKTASGGGGGGIQIHELFATSTTTSTDGTGYADVPISDFGISDPDKLVIISAEWIETEFCADPTDARVGYSILRPEAKVRLMVKPASSISAVGLRFRVVYTTL